MWNPAIRSFIRLKQRRSVLLPHPEGPISAVILFRGISIDTSRSASAVPYQTERSRAARTIGAASGGGGGVGEGGGATWGSERLISVSGRKKGSSGRALTHVAVADDDGRRVHAQEQDEQQEDARGGDGLEPGVGFLGVVVDLD